MVAISFADDQYLYALQAADLVAGLTRLEITRKWKRDKYEYKELFEALSMQPEKHEKLWFAGMALGDKESLSVLAKDLKKEWDKAQKAEGK
jgi:hypothetical protein